VILTDREIQIYIDRGLIAIDPPPETTAYQSTSVDLTLDPVVNVLKEQQPQEIPGLDRGEDSIDPTKPGFKVEDVIKALSDTTTIDVTGYLLRPGKLLLGMTREYVDLKEARLGARVEGKSSLARIGLSVHVTAPTIHAGFEGRIRLEIMNHGILPIRLKPGMRICQLIFEQTVGTPDKGYRGQFRGQ
jgi:dCTP deaminase